MPSSPTQWDSGLARPSYPACFSSDCACTGQNTSAASTPSWCQGGVYKNCPDAYFSLPEIAFCLIQFTDSCQNTGSWKTVKNIYQRPSQKFSPSTIHSSNPQQVHYSKLLGVGISIHRYFLFFFLCCYFFSFFFLHLLIVVKIYLTWNLPFLSVRFSGVNMLFQCGVKLGLLAIFQELPALLHPSNFQPYFCL